MPFVLEGFSFDILRSVSRHASRRVASRVTCFKVLLSNFLSTADLERQRASLDLKNDHFDTISLIRKTKKMVPSSAASEVDTLKK